MKLYKIENLFVVLMVVTILSVSVAFVLRSEDSIKQAAAISAIPAVTATAQVAPADVYVPPQKLSNPPEIIKAVYVTGYSAGSQKYLDYLSSLFKSTQINAVVVDIKGSSGAVSYASGAADVKKYNLYNGAVKDIDTLVKFFHDQNIYVIGRIAVFEDPVYAKARPELAIYNKNDTTDLSNPVLWQDNNKLAWMDPTSKDVWDYNISLAKDAFYHGFDEVNFDYVRFPSDGKTGNMGFPVWDGKTLMAEKIKEFFTYVHENLAGDPPLPGTQASAWRGKISVDLFGQTTTNTDDMGIGQIIENAFENFDYVSPMVYPSHYINGFMGFANPADHPYEIIKYEMGTALEREQAFLSFLQASPVENKTSVATAPNAPQTLGAPAPTPVVVSLAKFRPWLQDFRMGADYTAPMIEQEIQATQDSLGNNFSGFMLWNPSNIYTQGAIQK
jgi:hypothetical protein